MKRDPIEALVEIRKLCVEAAPSPFLFARIERICRHALEDYDGPEVVGDIVVGSVKVVGQAEVGETWQAPWQEVAPGVLVNLARVTTVQGCKLCQLNPVAYPGAEFCGAACSQRWESGERP